MPAILGKPLRRNLPQIVNPEICSLDPPGATVDPMMMHAVSKQDARSIDGIDCVVRIDKEGRMEAASPALQFGRVNKDAFDHHLIWGHLACLVLPSSSPSFLEAIPTRNSPGIAISSHPAPGIGRPVPHQVQRRLMIAPHIAGTN